MENILITGATGNVGMAIRQHFVPSNNQRLYLATREKSPSNPDELYFDFEDPEESAESLGHIHTLFLLRPPHISDVKTYFAPIIRKAVEKGVEHLLFLSVQGAEDVSFIPHAKIETLIRESGLPYTFFRPSYFMQNLSTTLLDDIKTKNRIFLPAGKAPFLWVDVSDIGKAIAAVLRNTAAHRNQAYTITGTEYFTFGQVAQMLSQTLERKIDYLSPGLLRFFFAKRREGVGVAYIFVLIMLHYLARFQKVPAISPDLPNLTGEAPATLKQFMESNREVWK
jgi:uncharacterized protein YbjT (DUF2867 family)